MSLPRLVFAALLLGGICFPSATARGEDHPKLVIVVSVDQLCQEYLQRFGGNLNDKGFFRMVEKQGASTPTATIPMPTRIPAQVTRRK